MLALRRLVLIAVAVLLPAAAQACPSCVNTVEQNRNAYRFTAALMSLLPLAMVFGLAWWWKRMNRAAAVARNHPPASVPPPQGAG